jgi:hypothetical protein
MLSFALYFVCPEGCVAIPTVVCRMRSTPFLKKAWANLPWGPGPLLTPLGEGPGLRLCLLPSVAPGPMFLLRLRYAPAQVCEAP